MEQWSERCSLASGGDVGRAKIGDNVACEQLRKQRPVAKLPGAPLGRAMQDGVTMQADHVDTHPGVACNKLFDRFGMKPGEPTFNLADGADAAQDRSQSFAKRVLVSDCQRRARNHPFFAIGLDHRDVDAIERRAAHQPKCTPNLLLLHPRVLWFVPRAYVR